MNAMRYQAYTAPYKIPIARSVTIKCIAPLSLYPPVCALVRWPKLGQK